MAKHPAAMHANPTATTDNGDADLTTADFGSQDQAHSSPGVLAAAKKLGVEYSVFIAKHRAAKPKATATTVAGDRRTRPSQRQQDQELQGARGEARMTTAGRPDLGSGQGQTHSPPQPPRRRPRSSTPRTLDLDNPGEHKEARLTPGQHPLSTGPGTLRIPALQPAGTPDQCMLVAETDQVPMPTGNPTNLGARVLPAAPLLSASNGAANNLGLQPDSSLSKKRRTGLSKTDWKTMDYQDTESEE
jgi:hypothetical protein